MFNKPTQRYFCASHSLNKVMFSSQPVIFFAFVEAQNSTGSSYASLVFMLFKANSGYDVFV